MRSSGAPGVGRSASFFSSALATVPVLAEGEKAGESPAGAAAEVETGGWDAAVALDRGEGAGAGGGSKLASADC